MSILVLVDDITSDVKMIEWFQDPKFSNVYPALPVIELTWNEFMAGGWTFAQGHFERYRVIRQMKDYTGELYKDPKSKKMLKRQHVIFLYDDGWNEGCIVIAPMRFKRYDLGCVADMEHVEKGRVMENATIAEFNQEFAKVIEAVKT